MNEIQLTEYSIELKELIKNTDRDIVDMCIACWMVNKVAIKHLTIEQCFHIYHSVLKALEMITEIYKE